MDDSIIVTTPAQLRAIIADEVSAILPKLADFRRKHEPVETDGMRVEDAAKFLTAQGIPTTRATLYNLVYKHTIPYKKFGRRTVFSKRAAVVDRIPYRPFGGQAGRCCIAYLRERTQEMNMKSPRSR